jgi:hypothetical protein
LLVTHRTHARAHYDDLLNITKTECLSDTPNSTMHAGYAEARNMVFSKVTSAIR